jgi:hypothetical protein
VANPLVCGTDRIGTFSAGRRFCEHDLTQLISLLNTSFVSMHGRSALWPSRRLAAIRLDGGAQNRLMLPPRNQARSIESGARSHNATDILSMVAPWPFARAELRDAAPVRVDNLSRHRAGTLIAVIGNAIVVLVTLTKSFR